MEKIDPETLKLIEETPKHSLRTMQRYAKQGKLKAIKPGRDWLTTDKWTNQLSE